MPALTRRGKAGALTRRARVCEKPRRSLDCFGTRSNRQPKGFSPKSGLHAADSLAIASAGFSRAQARCRRKSPPDIGLVAMAPGLRGYMVATREKDQGASCCFFDGDNVWSACRVPRRPSGYRAATRRGPRQAPHEPTPPPGWEKDQRKGRPRAALSVCNGRCRVQRTATSTRRASAASPPPVVSIGLSSARRSSAMPWPTSHCCTACARCFASSALTAASPLSSW